MKKKQHNEKPIIKSYFGKGTAAAFFAPTAIRS